MNTPIKYKISDLPTIPKLAYRGLPCSLVLAGIATLVLNTLNVFLPNLDPGNQVWFIPLLGVIWFPALVGLCCGYLSIIKYPELSKFIRVRDPIITTTDSFVWPLLGILLILIGLTFAFSAFENHPIGARIGSTYMGITFMFNGYLLSSYDRDKNIVTATFLDITRLFGVALAPIYFPALILGYWNYSRRKPKQVSQ